MSQIVSRPSSSQLVPDEVSVCSSPGGGRTETTTWTGDRRPETSDRYRWLEQVRERQARQERTRQLRAELAAARTAGKARRHAERLRRTRAADRPEGTPMTTTTTTKTPDGPPCPGCGVNRTETADQEHGAVLLCLNPKCPVDQ